MRAAVTVDLPNVMKGVPVEVPPVGLVENGSTAIVELNQYQIDYLKHAPYVTLEKPPEGIQDEDVRQPSSSAALSPVDMTPEEVEALVLAEREEAPAEEEPPPIVVNPENKPEGGEDQ